MSWVIKVKNEKLSPYFPSLGYSLPRSICSNRSWWRKCTLKSCHWILQKESEWGGKTDFNLRILYCHVHLRTVKFLVFAYIPVKPYNRLHRGRTQRVATFLSTVLSSCSDEPGLPPHVAADTSGSRFTLGDPSLLSAAWTAGSLFALRSPSLGPSLLSMSRPAGSFSSVVHPGRLLPPLRHILRAFRITYCWRLAEGDSSDCNSRDIPQVIAKQNNYRNLH